MAIVNRTPDSFYRPGMTWDEGAALARVHEVVAEGADILDVGGVPAKPGQEVTAAQEIRRVVPFIEAVRAAHPGLVISVDTWRHDVGRAACEAGANLLNDTWGGWDPKLAEVAAELGRGDRLLARGRAAAADAAVSHRVRRRGGGRARHRARPRRAGAAAGVDPARIIIDPAHDFGKNSWHSLEVTRRLGELTATGWPVLLSASHKDFVGESLGAGIEDRLAGTLATTAVAAWLGARIFRAHNVTETRQALDMVAAIRGDLPPARLRQGAGVTVVSAAVVPSPPLLVAGADGAAAAAA